MRMMTKLLALMLALMLYLEVGLIYLMFSTILTKLQRVGEKKLDQSVRREG